MLLLFVAQLDFAFFSNHALFPFLYLASDITQPLQLIDFWQSLYKYSFVTPNSLSSFLQREYLFRFSIHLFSGL